MKAELHNELQNKGVVISAWTINELLSTEIIKHNQTKLALFLATNRGTLRKYMGDLFGEKHSITYVNGKFRFFHE